MTPTAQVLAVSKTAMPEPVGLDLPSEENSTGQRHGRTDEIMSPRRLSQRDVVVRANVVTLGHLTDPKEKQQATSNGGFSRSQSGLCTLSCDTAVAAAATCSAQLLGKMPNDTVLCKRNTIQSPARKIRFPPTYPKTPPSLRGLSLILLSNAEPSQPIN